ncbi:MAG: hypothetical protein ACYC3Q_09890 [Gemmatimonadaceae bacterium]
MTRLLTRTTAFAALAISLAACGNDSATGPSSNAVSGTYALQTVNGNPLPFTFTDPQSGTTVSLQSDVFVFSANGTWTETAVARYTDQTGAVQTETLNESGTYQKNGTAITLRYSDFTNAGTGTIESNSLVLVLPGYSYSYTRR